MNKLAITLLAFLFCTKTIVFAQDYPPDIKKILDKGTLVVGTYQDERPPFFMTGADGKLTGLDVEIASSIAKELGVALKIDRTSKSPDEVIEKVFNHKIDLGIAKLAAMLSRAKKISFSDPYLVSLIGLLVDRMFLEQAKGTSAIFNLLNDAKFKIGILKGSEYFSEIANEVFPNAQKVILPEWKDLVTAVRDKIVDAAIVDEVVVKTFGISHPDLVLQIASVEIADEKEFVSIAFPWDSPNLGLWLNTFITRNWSNIKIDDYLRKYLNFFEPKGNNGQTSKN